jgi:hypothetical protein
MKYSERLRFRGYLIQESEQAKESTGQSGESHQEEQADQYRVALLEFVIE